MRAWMYVALVSLFVFNTACTKKPVAEEESSTDGGGGGGNVAVGTAAVFVKYNVDTKTDLTVTVANVLNGDTVTLYSDSGCTTEVANSTASSTKVEFNLTGLSAGTHNYYAKSGTGPCSTVHATYTIASCPAGYVKVDGDTANGIKPFCVMQFEAKNSGGFPVSVAAGVPWVPNVSAIDMKAKCRSLNTGGTTGFDLISSLEWSTIANDFERNETDNGSLGASIYKGNSNNDASALAVADINNPWNGITHQGAPNAIPELRRTLHLRNGGVIWDMAGNAFEIVDYGQTATFQTPPACSTSSNYNPYEVLANNHCLNTPKQHYMTIAPTTIHYNGYGYASTVNVGNRVISRGGGWSNTSSGVTSWNMSAGDPNTQLSTGFRCVYRLNPPTLIQPPVLAMDINPTTWIPFTGATPGETITLSTNRMCTDNVGSTVATSTTPTVTTTLGSAGTATFYYRTTSVDGVAGPCQAPSASYTYKVCPTGFVHVPANAVRGTASFCVSKFEARRDGGYNATINPADTYFTGYQGQTGNNKCLAMNAYPETNYRLMTNTQWMTIADNLYNVGFNWSSGVVGDGMMPRGVSDSNAAATLGDPGSNYWFGVTVSGSPTTDFKYRRMMRMSNGSEIWDFAGNISEIVDNGTDETTYTGFPACLSGDQISTEELANAPTSCPAIVSAKLQPYSALGSAEGMGMFQPRTNAGSAARGGHYNSGVFAGAYAFQHNNDPSQADSNMAFRCVWIP